MVLHINKSKAYGIGAAVMFTVSLLRLNPDDVLAVDVIGAHQFVHVLHGTIHYFGY